MSARLLVVLSVEPRLGGWLAAGLARGAALDGWRVVVVDADPEGSQGAGVEGARGSFLGVLRGESAEPSPPATPEGAHARGAIAHLPALLPDGAADPGALTRALPPGLDAALRTLRCGDSVADLVVLVAPCGLVPLATNLGALADVLVSAGGPDAHSIRVVLAMAQSVADRREDVPQFRVALSAAEDRLPVLFRAGVGPTEYRWLELGRVAPEQVLSAPEDREAPQDPVPETDWRATIRLLANHHQLQHPDAGQRFRYAVDGCVLADIQSAFTHLWNSAGRVEARAVFDALCNRQGGSLIGAVGALLAVRDAPDHTLDDLWYIGGVAVQRQRLSDPSRLSRPVMEVWRFMHGLLGEHPNEFDQARLHTDYGDALLHYANYLRDNHQDASDVLAEALAVLTYASALDSEPRHRLRLAVVLAGHAYITGQLSTLPLARDCLQDARLESPEVALRWTTQVLIRYASASGDTALWQEVIERAQELARHASTPGLYQAAVAYAHLGRHDVAISLLTRASQQNPATWHSAFLDPDFAPLFDGAGSHHFPLSGPQSQE